jgi:hypothetical protein
VGTIVRSLKQGGSTTLQDGQLAPAADVDTDVTTLFNEVNGNLSDVNVSGSANIDPSKIGDYSATAAEQATATSPGTSASPILATTMEGELARIRYALERLGLGVDATRVDGSGTGEAAWIDPPARSVSLVRNGTFAVHSAGSPAAPDGWTLVGMPTTCALANIEDTEGIGKELNVVCQASQAEGISQAFASLKAGALYLVAARVKVNAGTVRLTTSGADAGSSYRDVDLSSTSSSYTTLKAVVQTQDPVATLTVSLIGTTDATQDDFDVAGVWLFELGAERGTRREQIVVRAFTTTPQAALTPNAAYVDVTGTTVALTVPGPGYYIEVSFSANAANTGTTTALFVALDENGSTVPSSLEHSQQASATNWVSISGSYVNLNPTPGTTYTYKHKARTSAGGTVTLNSATNGTTGSYVIARAIPFGS